MFFGTFYFNQCSAELYYFLKPYFYGKVKIALFTASLSQYLRSDIERSKQLIDNEEWLLPGRALIDSFLSQSPLLLLAGAAESRTKMA